MRYIAISGWKRMEQHGNFDDAIRLILEELTINYLRTTHLPKTPDTEIIADLYFSVAYNSAIPHQHSEKSKATLKDVKNTRKEIKSIISRLKS